ncbi:MAG: hypothetical protein PVI59_12585 [Anaerolineae bacterium]
MREPSGTSRTVGPGLAIYRDPPGLPAFQVWRVVSFIVAGFDQVGGEAVPEGVAAE